MKLIPSVGRHGLTAVLVLVCLALRSDAASLFVDGNLILTNPLQSSVIFVAIVVSSVVLEMVVHFLQRLDNKHLRVTMRLFMEEVTVLGLAEVGLLTVNFTVESLDSNSNTEFCIVALVLLYMTIAYGIINSCLAIALQANEKKWRTFEWGRLEATAHHSSVERLFAQGRRWFVVLLNRVVSSQRQTIKELPQVAFSAFIGRLERKYLRAIFDITFVSWGGLGVMVILNLCRQLIVGKDSLVAEVHSFILLVGYITTIVFVSLQYLVRHRLSRFFSAIRMDDLNVDGAAGTVSSGPLNQVAKKKEDACAAALLFGSFEITLQLYKVCHLIMLWYIAMYIVVVAELSYQAHEWFSFLVALEVIFPIVLFYWQFPKAIFVALMCVALGQHVDEDAVDTLKSGCALDSDSSSGSEEDEEDILERRAMLANNAAQTRRVDSVRVRPSTRNRTYDEPDEYTPCEDEPEESFGTFHDSVAEDQVPPGDPARVMGVPPVGVLEKRYKVKPLDPVFL